MKLDVKPKSWEDRAQMFIAHLIEYKGAQSCTIKSYVSAIKHMLINDKYEWKDGKILLAALTRACRLTNDQARV